MKQINKLKKYILEKKIHGGWRWLENWFTSKWLMNCEDDARVNVLTFKEQSTTVLKE